jgi:pimeloyl-ACP methyl ester carboxylesterase
MPFLHINGTKLHCHEQGEGTALVFVHPPFIGSHVFTYLHHDLSQDHRTVLIDLRGHGHSGPGRTQLSFPLIVEDIRQTLDQMDIGEAYLCGYSVGSMPVLMALLAEPERFKGGILLSGTSALTDVYSRSTLQAANLSLRLQMKEPVAFSVALGNADSRLTYENLHRKSMIGDARRWREYTSECLRYSFTRELPQIRQGMLLLCGQSNQTYVNYAKIMHDRLPDSEMYVIRGAAHQIPTKEPVKAAETIRRWIAERELRSVADTFMGREALDRAWYEQGILSESDLL